MFMAPQDTLPGQADEEFSRPVESIMRCEDFKSNFARRLSNRYSSRSPMSSPRQAGSLQPRTQNKPETKLVPERIETNAQLSKNYVEQNSEVVKPSDEAVKSEMRSTEVTALNMEVETLRWQVAHVSKADELRKTEANRQMHIALLQQIVTFLNKVRDHIDNQKTEKNKDTSPIKSHPRSFNVADLPRSRSVLHVNKNLEYPNYGKKISTKKISKSISNVNGYKDYTGIWNQSKISLANENDCTEKISEEMSRLITLANTVLSTKLPDLTCMCTNVNNNEFPTIKPDDNIGTENELLHTIKQSSFLNIIKENSTNPTDVKTHENENVILDTFASKYVNGKNNSDKDFIVSQSPISHGLENDFNSFNLNEKSNHSPMTNIKNTAPLNGKALKSPNIKRNDYSHVSNFIEDESGFSSMSSFQEIGIPIISIIPPSPCKELGFMDEIPDILNEPEKWKSNSMDINKQAVKVFWV